MAITFRSILFFLVIFSIAPASKAATRVDLDRNWQFRTDPKGAGESSGWMNAMPTATVNVRVPHTWNIGANDDYEGRAWYFQRYFLSAETKAAHRELHFGATFYKSKVWLNGALLGDHEGGYTEYWFDVSSRLKAGENFIAVEIDNRVSSETIPGIALRDSGRWYDWWHYGGIVRNVWLTIGDGDVIRRQRITSKLSDEVADVVTEVVVENHHTQASKVSVSAAAYAPGGEVAGRSPLVTIELAGGEARKIPLTLTISKPELWNIDRPRLYRMEVALRHGEAGELIDTKSDSFGVRTIELRDRHLLINNERVRLTGMTRHEESPWEGLAETSGTIRHDYDELKQLHVTMSRPVHYPQNDEVLDYADEHGILLTPEIPIWQFSPEQLGNPKIIALARKMMQEMIEQDQNHPSIWAWSLCNESTVASETGRAYIKQMKGWVNALDPGRYVSYASDAMAKAPDPGLEATGDIDFIMLNAYWGTFHGSEANMVPVLDKIGRDYPAKMVIVSEFGAPGNFAGNTVDGDKLRIHIMESQMAEFAKRDWIGGAIFWCYADYKSHHGIWPGYTEGYDDIGVEDENRQRRPSYFVWKKLNEPVNLELAFKLDASNDPIGFEAEIVRKPLNSMPSYPLRRYQAVWELRDRDGKLLRHGQRELPDLEQTQRIVAAWPKEDWAKETLTMRIVDPQGYEVAVRAVDAVNGRFGGEDPIRTPH